MSNPHCRCCVVCDSVFASRWMLFVAGGRSLVQTAKFTELPKTASLPSIQQLMQEHSLYARRLDTLRAKLFLTDAEQLEEVRLKKLKLSLKDEMERLRRLGAS